jgi:maleylpyruvate isomerase
MTVPESGERLATSLSRMDRGSAFFANQLALLTDEQLSEPSRLPDWTRLHVVSHIARNARALGNLLHWAETGIESPMYPSPEHRRDDIEAGARLPAADVRVDALEAATSFRAAVSALPAAAWDAEVRTALGLEIQANEVPWIRGREVWVHAVDLGAGATFEDVDPDVGALLLHEAVNRLAESEDCPAALLVSSGPSGATLVIGPAVGDPPVISGSTQALAAWVLGRTDGVGLRSSGPLPALPRWL